MKGGGLAGLATTFTCVAETEPHWRCTTAFELPSQVSTNHTNEHQAARSDLARHLPHVPPLPLRPPGALPYSSSLASLLSRTTAFLFLLVCLALAPSPELACDALGLATCSGELWAAAAAAVSGSLSLSSSSSAPSRERIAVRPTGVPVHLRSAVWVHSLRAKRGRRSADEWGGWRGEKGSRRAGGVVVERGGTFATAPAERPGGAVAMQANLARSVGTGPALR